MVEGPGTDDLADGARDGDGKFRLNLGTGKKDTLVRQKLGGICDLRGGAGIKKDVLSQDRVEVILEFDTNVGVDADDQYVWLFVGKGHRRPPE